MKRLATVIFETLLVPVLIGVVALTLTLLASACGGSGSTGRISQAPKSNTQSDSVDVHVHGLSTDDPYYYYAIADITMPSGRVLTCARVDASDVSMSCNWPDYNRRVR